MGVVSNSTFVRLARFLKIQALKELFNIISLDPHFV